MFQIHIRYLLLYEFQKGTTIIYTIKNICEIYGKCIVKIWTYQIWFQKYQSGDVDIYDAPLSKKLKLINKDDL